MRRPRPRTRRVHGQLAARADRVPPTCISRAVRAAALSTIFVDAAGLLALCRSAICARSAKRAMMTRRRRRRCFTTLMMMMDLWIYAHQTHACRALGACAHARFARICTRINAWPGRASARTQNSSVALWHTHALTHVCVCPH